MLPTWSDFFRHPFTSLRMVYEVWKLDTMFQTARVAEMRKKDVDDMVKRAKYRKAHGLDEGFIGVKEDQSPRPSPEKREKFFGVF